MPTPSIKTDAICLGCGEHLFTTGAEIDQRVAAIELLKTGDDRKAPPNTIQAWCVSEMCPIPPRPHQDYRAIFTNINRIPAVVLPI